MEPIKESEQELIGRIHGEVQRTSEEPTGSEEQEGQQGIVTGDISKAVLDNWWAGSG